MLDYATLKLIWWGLLGILIIGFSVMDGFDLGIASILACVANTNTERRIVINTMGPVWEGNQAWLITLGGATFAAWPLVYSTVFSAFYALMFIALFGFILRPVSFKYRSKASSEFMRKFWDFTMILSGILPSFGFGLLIGNILQGVPFYLDLYLRVHYVGTTGQLFNLFALSCGMASLLAYILHGTSYLRLKVDGNIARKAQRIRQTTSLLLMLILIMIAFWAHSMSNYSIISHMHHAGDNNPLWKNVAYLPHALTINFYRYNWVSIFPIAAIFCLLVTTIGLWKNKLIFNFILTSFMITCVILTFGIAIFPFILPSSLHLASSLTVWDASSSRLTLDYMLIIVFIFLPLIILYTSWVYTVFRGKITEEFITNNDKDAY